MSERYEIREKIAEGGLGSVFVAFDTKLGRDVALKRVLASGVDASEAAQDLLNEAKTLSSLQHPNIVTVYDVDQDDEGTYVVMELLKGETLEDVVERGALTDADFEEVVRQTLEGMIAAQAAGLVHRDLKPSNIMVIWLPSGKFQCKILDFGLAKFGRKPSLQTEDQGEGIMGSIYFMAPEQFERAPLDMRTDMYSLGCLYYQALTTKYPFDGETGPAVMASHLEHRVVPPKKLRGDLPEWMSDWVMWLINRRMEDRPENAKTAWANFQSCTSAPPSLAPPQQVEAPAARVTRPLGGTRPVVVAPATVRAGGAPATQAALPQRKVPRPIKRAPQRKSSGSFLFVSIIGAVALAGFGAWFYAGYQEKAAIADQNATLDALLREDEPSGGYDIAEKLVGLIARGDPRSDQATYLLSMMEDVGVEAAILDNYPEVTRTDGKTNLLKALGKSGTAHAVETILAETKHRTPEVRQAALTSLGSSANSDHLELIIGVAPDLDASIERKLLSGALVSISSRVKGARRTLPYLRALKELEGDARDLIVGVLGNLGGPESLRIMEKELQSGETSRRRAAARALAAWPTSDPLPMLVAMAEDETDAGMKVVALRGVMRMAGLPGSVPSASQVEFFKRIAPLVVEPKAKREFLQALSGIADPGAKELAESLKSDEDGDIATVALKVSQAIDESMAKIVEVTSEAELPLANARIVGGYPELDETLGVLKAWGEEKSSVSWNVRIDEPGDYEIAIEQQSSDPRDNSYRVSLGTERLIVPVTKTGDDFKEVTVGAATIEEPGGYRLLIEPVTLQGELMVLKSVKLRRR